MGIPDARFYRPDALTVTKPGTSEHWMNLCKIACWTGNRVSYNNVVQCTVSCHVIFYHINTECFIIVIKLRMSTSTRNSAVADKPRDAFVQMEWRGWPNQRYQDPPEKWFLESGLSTSLTIRHGSIRHLWFPISVYSNFIPKTHRFFKYSTSKMLWPWQPVWGPSRSLKMSPFLEHYDFLLTFCSNYGSILCRFWDIQCRKMSWPWNPGQRSSGTIR